MLRLLLCILLLAFVLAVPVAGQDSQTRVANPANLDRAEAILRGVRYEAGDPWGIYPDLRSSISNLFKKQFTCQKEAFEQAKQDLLRKLESEMDSARRRADRRLGSPLSTWDRYLKELVELRDFIKSLQYRECQEPTRENASAQASARGTFRRIFYIKKLTACEIDECPPGTVIRGYDWKHYPSLGTLFENLSIYQKICDEEGFNKQKARIAKLLLRYERDKRLSKKTARKARAALEKIEFVHCPKTHTQTAEQQPASGGTTPNPNATPSPNTTPTPAVTPGPQNEGPDDGPLPGLDDEDISYEPGASYTIAVQVPDACLGKIYTVTEGTVVQTGEIPVTWTDIPVATGTEETQVDVPSENVPSENVPSENVPSEDAPAEPVPVASVPEEDTQETPQIDVPVVSGPEKSQEQEDEEIDLGLAKSEETVLILALTGQNAGEQITKAVVKSLGEEPPLPGNPGVETAFDADAFFEDDVDAGVSGDDGSVEISIAADAAASSTDQSGNGQPQDAGPGQTLTVNLPIDDVPRESLVAGLADGMSAAEAVSDSGGDPALAQFVSRSFNVGTHTLLVLSAPRSEAPALKDQLKNSDVIAWFELNLCRNKEEVYRTRTNTGAEARVDEEADAAGQPAERESDAQNRIQDNEQDEKDQPHRQGEARSEEPGGSIRNRGWGQFATKGQPVRWRTAQPPQLDRYPQHKKR